MKIRYTGIVASIVAMLVDSRAHAQTNFLAALPTGSVAQLRAYAFERVASMQFAGRTLSSSSMKYDEVKLTVAYAKTNGVVDVEEVFAAISAQQLTLRMTNSTVYVSEDVYLADTNGTTLFSSTASATLNPPTNNISTNTLLQVLDMSAFVPIVFTNAVSATIVQRDPNGNPIRTNTPTVQNGLLVFPAYFCGKSVETTIQLSDGTQVVYNSLGQCEGPPSQLKAILISQASATGLLTFRNTNSGVTMNIWIGVSTNDQVRSIAPLVQLVNTQTNAFDIGSWLVDPNGATPTLFATNLTVCLQGPSSSTTMSAPISSSIHHQVYTFYPGRYWITFSYPNGYGVVSNQFAPP